MGNMIQNELADDLVQIVGEIGHTIRWKNANYPCTVTEPTADSELSGGGFIQDGSFRVKIPRKCFNNGQGPFPSDNDRMEFDSEVWRVTVDSNKPGSAFFIITISAS